MGGKPSAVVSKTGAVDFAEPRFESGSGCPRCRGPMSPEFFMNRTEEGGYWAYPAWRCLCCGEVIDPLILLNRRRQKDPGETVVKQRGRPPQNHI